jgi:hypothetical protein
MDSSRASLFTKISTLEQALIQLQLVAMEPLAGLRRLQNTTQVVELERVMDLVLEKVVLVLALARHAVASHTAISVKTENALLVLHMQAVQGQSAVTKQHRLVEIVHVPQVTDIFELEIILTYLVINATTTV